MSLLERPSVRSSAPSLDDPAVRLAELEDAFRAWAQDPAKPDVVDLGQHGQVPMVELARRLRGSPARLGAPASVQIGLPSDVSIGTAVAALLQATVDPDGPRCRSLRAASYYLCGLVRLGADFRPVVRHSGSSADDSRGHCDVR